MYLQVLIMTMKKQTNRFNQNSDNFSLVTESPQSILIDFLYIQSYKKIYICLLIKSHLKVKEKSFNL
jgi:hypothetical protein